MTSTRTEIPALIHIPRGIAFQSEVLPTDHALRTIPEAQVLGLPSFVKSEDASAIWEKLSPSEKYDFAIYSAQHAAERAVKVEKADYAIFSIAGVPCSISLSSEQFIDFRSRQSEEIGYLEKMDVAPMPASSKQDLLEQFKTAAQDLLLSEYFKHAVFITEKTPRFIAFKDESTFYKLIEDLDDVSSVKILHREPKISPYAGTKFPRKAEIPTDDISDSVDRHLDGLTFRGSLDISDRGKREWIPNPNFKEGGIDPEWRRNIIQLDSSVRLPTSPSGFSQPSLHITRVLNSYLVENGSETGVKYYDPSSKKFRMARIEYFRPVGGSWEIPSEFDRKDFVYLKPGDKIKINNFSEFILPEFKQKLDPFPAQKESPTPQIPKIKQVIALISASLDFLMSAGKVRFYFTKEGECKSFLPPNSGISGDPAENKNGNANRRKDGEHNIYFKLYDELKDLHLQKYGRKMKTLELASLNLNIENPAVHIGGVLSSTHMLNHHRILAARDLGINIVVDSSSVNSFA